MSKEIIKSIELNIGSVTVKVTPKEAQALFDALAELLGKPRVVECNRPHWWYGQTYTVPGNFGTAGTSGLPSINAFNCSDGSLEIL